MSNVTVLGAGNQTVGLCFDTEESLTLARQLAGLITAGVQNGSIVAASDKFGAPPPVPPGKAGEFVQTKSGTVMLPNGYTALVETAAKALVFGSNAENQMILSGTSSDLTFISPGGSGTVVAAGDHNRIVLSSGDDGDWRITTGNGDDQDCRTDYLGEGTSPGNYGWLDKPRVDCFADASVDVWSPGDPGNNPEIRDCGAEILNQTVLLAIWQDADLSGGNNAEYEIIAFVGFTVTGYSLSGFNSPGFTCPPNPADPGTPTGSLRCFRGVFTEATFDGDFGGYYNTGVTSVKMIG